MGELENKVVRFAEEDARAIEGSYYYVAVTGFGIKGAGERQNFDSRRYRADHLYGHQAFFLGDSLADDEQMQRPLLRDQSQFIQVARGKRVEV